MLARKHASFVEILEFGFFGKRPESALLLEGIVGGNQASVACKRTSLLYMAAMREIPITGANKMLMIIPRSGLIRDMRPRRTANDIRRAIEARKKENLFP